MYAYRQEGCIESIAPAHPTYPRHHLNSHHVNHTHRYDPRRCSMHAGAIAKSLFVVASLPLDSRRARPYLPWVRKGREGGWRGGELKLPPPSLSPTLTTTAPLAHLICPKTIPTPLCSCLAILGTWPFLSFSGGQNGSGAPKQNSAERRP